MEAFFILFAFILAAALLGLVVVMLSVFRNVGPLSLEEYARRNDIVFIPLGRQLVDELQSWSKPVRMRIDNRDHPLLGDLVLTTKLSDTEN